LTRLGHSKSSPTPSKYPSLPFFMIPKKPAEGRTRAYRKRNERLVAKLVLTFHIVYYRIRRKQTICARFWLPACASTRPSFVLGFECQDDQGLDKDEKIGNYDGHIIGQDAIDEPQKDRNTKNQEHLQRDISSRPRSPDLQQLRKKGNNRKRSR
jgi:hypothetical protein